MASPLTSKDFVRLLDDRLLKVYTEQRDILPVIVDQFYTKVTENRAWLEYFTMGSIPDPAEFNGTITYQGMSPGYHVKIEPKEYAGGLVVERRLLDTERYDIIETQTKKLARAANRKINKIAHEPFAYHDSTQFTFLTHEASEALCANTHASKSGLRTSGYDNLMGLPFNYTNLEACRIQAVGFRDDIGERVQNNFDTILHPTNLAEEVWQVLNAQKEPDQMTNNENFARGRWKAIELPYLDDYDTTDWMVVDASAMKENLIWHEAVSPEFMSTTDFDTLMRKYADYFVVGWGWIDWPWILSNSCS